MALRRRALYCLPLTYARMIMALKILAALNCAAARGVKIQLLIDGIYQQLFLAGSSDFQALASYENVEVGVYNPVTPVNLFKVNYRMHDKYLIVDEKNVSAGRTQQQ